ncbi:MAG: ATP-binding protein, partial [Bacteroidota bacterium]
MTFSLHLFPNATDCFVLLKTADTLFVSPRYADQRTGLVAIERLLRRLRQAEEELALPTAASSIFDAATPPFLVLTPPVQAEEWQQALAGLQAASTAQDTFQVSIVQWQQTEATNGANLPLESVFAAYFSSPGAYFPQALRRFTMGSEPDQQFHFTVNDKEDIEVLFGPAAISPRDRDAYLRDLIMALTETANVEINDQDGFVLAVKNAAGRVLASSRKYASAAAVQATLAQLQARAPAWQFALMQSAKWTIEREETIDFRVQSSGSTIGMAIDTADAVGGLVQTNPCTPLFHVMNPYGKRDIDRFHGREREVEELYEQLYDTRLLVLYGEQAVGKTSLVQCGLANRIKAARYQGVFVRRWTNLDKAIERQVRKAVQEYVELDDGQTYSLQELLRMLYEHSFKPTLLVLDQLEKLFQAQVGEGQRTQFFNTIQTLLSNNDYPLKILLVVREEQLAKLADYDYLVPTLLDHRYHLGHLPTTKIIGLVDGILGSLMASGKIKLEDPTGVSQKIKEKFTQKGEEEVGLGCMQIYLHETQQFTCAQTTGGLPVFSPQVVEEMGDPQDVIRQYTQQRISELEAQLPETADGTRRSEQAEALERMVQTAIDCGCADEQDRSTWVAMWHERGKKNKRMVALLLLSLFGLLLSALGMGWIYTKLQGDEACLTVIESEDCTDWLLHLCGEKEATPCTQELLAKLDAADCPVWQDYQLAMRSNDC